MKESDQEKRERIARAAAADAGNRNMQKHARAKWNEDDYNTACREYNRLLPA